MKKHIKWLALIFFTVVQINNSIAATNNSRIIINNDEHVLIAPDGKDFQWFYNGEKIQGANLQNLAPGETGTYTVAYIDESNKQIKQSIAVKVEEGEIIQIFIIGDSTVANYSSSQYPFAGWGQVLHHFFDSDKISIHNRARGGRSSRSFIEEGLWDNVVAELDSGYYVFVQFGHNDRDASNASRYTPPADYKIYLTKYVNDSREKGAIPVLVSPMNMNGTSNVFPDYREAMLEVAEELNVPFLDLNLKSVAFYQEVGVEYAKYFIHMGLEPGEYTNYPDGYSDYWTHYQEMGALTMARIITEEIADKKDTLELTPLAEALKPLYHVSVSMNKPDAGVATISGDFPEGATVTLKTRLTNAGDVLKYWVDSTVNTTFDGNLIMFTMEPRDYDFTGFVTDCFGTVDGTASIDECGVCTGGETGLDPCSDQISFLDFCETDMNAKIILGAELYSLFVSTDSISNAYISQPLNIATSDTFMFAIIYNNPTANEALNIYVDDSLSVSDLSLKTEDSWNTVEFNLFLNSGEHTIKIQTTSESGGVLLDYLALYSEAVSKGDCAAEPKVNERNFVQSDSLIVIEAENYNELRAGTDGDNWTKALFDDASMGSVVISPPGNSYGAASTAQSDAPAIKYNIDFPYTGNYSIWARVYAFTGSSDSYHLGLDGKVSIEKIDLYDSGSRDVYEEFTWMHVSIKKLAVSKTGVQSLEVFCREPNLIIDKIILSLDANYTPEAYGPEQTLDTTITGIDDLITNNADLQIMVYPNPAQEQLNIAYELTESDHININVVNLNGQTIRNLVSGRQMSGQYKITWNLNDSASGTVPDGLYLIRFQSGNSMRIQKVLIRR